MGVSTMMVKQISVFLENKPGKLKELTDVLRENNINMRALSVADAQPAISYPTSHPSREASRLLDPIEGSPQAK